jgi:phytoene desaturase
MYVVAESLVKIGKELGVKYEYKHDVSKIVTENGIAKGIITNKKFISASIVVSNADLKFTETKLLEIKNQTYPNKYWKERKAGPSALLLYLGVKGSLPELVHHNLFFIKDWQKNFDQIYKDKVWPERASIYLSKTTATDKTTAPKGHENIFILVPLPPGKSKSKKETDKFVDIYLEQIEQMTGVSDLRKRIVFKEVRSPDYFGETFNAWENTALGMSHTLRQSAFLRPSVKSKKVENLYYVGAGTQPGLGVPMCLISAQLVYKYLVKDWSSSAPTKITKVKF